MHQPFDDHFLSRYRQLLDAEDAAFDEVEHAVEEGNRPHFDEEMAIWQATLTKKMHFLNAAGFDVALAVSPGV